MRVHRLSSRASYVVCISSLTVAVGYAVFNYGGLADCNFALLLLGLAGILCQVSGSAHAPLDERLAGAAALLLPAYVVFQLLPWPLFLLRIFSPTRAELARALGSVMPAPSFAPLSIAPPATWFNLLFIAAYAMIFLLARESAGRSTGMAWVTALPLIVIGALEAVLGLVQKAMGAEAVLGTYANKNHFAGLLEMVLPLAVIFGIALVYRGGEQGISPVLSLIQGCAVLSMAFVVFAAILSSLSRMGFISMLGSLFVMGSLALGPQLSGWRKWPAIAGLALLVLYFFVFLPPDALVEQFGKLSSGSTATEARWPIWKDTLHLIAAYPLFGSGLGTYFPAFLRYQTSGLNWSWLQAHNDYLQSLAELGVIGFLIAAALITAVFARSTRAAISAYERETRFLGVACAGALSAILIHSIADFNLYIPANAMVLAWIAGLAAGFPVSARKERADPFVRKAALCLGCLLSIYSAGWLLLTQKIQTNPWAERMLCHFGFCDTSAMLAIQTRWHGGDVASIPPSELQEFLRRDPAGPYRWADLGEALQRSGRKAEAAYCFSRTLALGPNIPYMLVRAANYHFDIGDNRTALELTSRIWGTDPTSEEAVLEGYDQRKIPLDDILRYGLATPDASREFFHRLVNQKRIPDSVKTWSWLIPRGYADKKDAVEYVDTLLRLGEPAAAVEAWALFTRVKGYPEPNVIFNGDFESDPSGSRFDWALGEAEGMAIDFDSQGAFSGARSLRVQFDGTGSRTSIPVSQMVFVRPGRYRFEARVRAPDAGVVFSLQDAETPARLNVSVEAQPGERDWTLIEKTFEVTAPTRLLRLGLSRPAPPRKGIVRIDRVSLSGISPGSK